MQVDAVEPCPVLSPCTHCEQNFTSLERLHKHARDCHAVLAPPQTVCHVPQGIVYTMYIFVQAYATGAELSAHRRSAKHGRRAPTRSGRCGGVQARRVNSDKQRSLPLKKRQHIRAEQQIKKCVACLSSTIRWATRCCLRMNSSVIYARRRTRNIWHSRNTTRRIQDYCRLFIHAHIQVHVVQVRVHSGRLRTTIRLLQEHASAHADT